MQESGISLKDVRAVYRALQMMSQVAEKRAQLGFSQFSHGPQCSWTPIVFVALDDILQPHQRSQLPSFMEMCTCKVQQFYNFSLNLYS